jgi:exopolysaccharide biosynthesis polyprenyl glycosylphosphotransferase
MTDLAVPSTPTRAPEPLVNRYGTSWNARDWGRHYLTALVVTDWLAISLALVVGYLLRFGVTRPTIGGVQYLFVGVAVMAGWFVSLFGCGSYEPRFLAVGAEEFRRVLRASVRLVGAIALVCYVSKIAVARGFVAGVIPAGFLLLVLGRWAARRWLHAHRRRGEWSYRILAVGSRESVSHLVEQVARAPFAGLVVVAACVTDDEAGSWIAPGVPVVGSADTAVAHAKLLDVDVVAPTPYGLHPRFIKELGWALEGSGRHLVMASGLTDVAGPRIHVSPVAGLPLVWVDEPQFTGMARVAKKLVDFFGSLVLLVVLSPLLALTALLVKLSSPGPVLFRQQRAGLHGREFELFKFRSMYVDAAERRRDLVDLNESDGHLFKMRRDPRVTRVGRVIRRWSIDELPQLLNVLRGQMSLIGPRPLLVEDSDYSGHARRRLLVRPGLTGLWQVSGRSDLCWEEAVRLDLYYVENWSLALDLVILGRTVLVVVRGNGAY